MSSVYEDISIIACGTVEPTLPLFNYLKYNFGAHKNNYYFHPKYTDRFYTSSENNKCVVRSGGTYVGTFAFLNVTLMELHRPLYVRFINCTSYFGIGAGDPERVLNTRSWNYSAADSEGVFLAGWDTWIQPESIYAEQRKFGKNVLRISDTVPVKMEYRQGEMTITAGQHSLVFTVPPERRPCVCMFTNGITAKIIDEIEFNAINREPEKYTLTKETPPEQEDEWDTTPLFE